MPSRQLSSSPPTAQASESYAPTLSSPDQPHYQSQRLLTPLLASTASGCSLFLLILLCFRKLTGKRTATAADSESKPPYRFSFSLLRRATSNFSDRLGHGGFGPVFSGTLPSTHQSIAVKLMDSTSLQGEREFHNELFFASRLSSRYVVSAIGFCSDGKRRRFLLVYELMRNGNLQDALLRRKCPELMDWKKRFDIIVDIAKGIQYLHSCDPPVIHGDIKPSNILLDSNFSAKIGDFGLARLKSETEFGGGVLDVDDAGKMNGGFDSDVRNKKEEVESHGGVGLDDCGSVVVDTESVNTGFDEASVGLGQSPEGFVRISISETSPETFEVVTTSPETATMAMASPPEGTLDWGSVEGEKVAKGGHKNDKCVKGGLGKDLQWKQDDGVAKAGENKKVKDYVMQWIGTEISREGPKRDWGESTSSCGTTPGNLDKKKSKKRLEWWMSMDEEKNERKVKKEKRRPVREWWKEEYIEELARKKKKKKQLQKIGIDVNDPEDGWWGKNDDLFVERKKKTKSRSRGSHRSIDWWSEGLSGELQRAHWNSYDSASGEIPKSGGVSSTPSMRGTVCYVAPEYGYAGEVSERCDVYSFGVLLLVIISGRRPLQVCGSPMSEFQRANLLSWARHCACRGKLLELVDKSIELLDKEQAVLCITVALLCLQKSPSRRPSMKEVVGMLTGDLQPPKLPVELSPSTPSHFPFKSRRKVQ